MSRRVSSTTRQRSADPAAGPEAVAGDVLRDPHPGLVGQRDDAHAFQRIAAEVEEVMIRLNAKSGAQAAVTALPGHAVRYARFIPV